MVSDEDIYRYAIKNAFLHDGKANSKAIVGKMIALDSNIKKELGKLMPKINEIVSKVNEMNFEEIKSEYEKFEESYELKGREQRIGLSELAWAKNEKVVTRFAPNPNGPFHLGSSRAAILSAEYAKMYNGKFILRFEDTDPKVKKPIDNPEKLFSEDLNWLGIIPEEIYFQSDRLEIYYEHIRKLIQMNKAYVCKCDSNDWRELTRKKTACKHRELTVEIQMSEFEKMLSNELKEGEAVLRLKTDLNHPDPSVRDYWLAKIVNNPKHPRIGSKNKVWPAYNLASGIDDHLMGITLIIRGQEHSQNEDKQKYYYNYFGWTYPHTIHTGRASLDKGVLSTSKIREGIENGTFESWEDPRVATIRSFRRRGYKAEAIREIILQIGPRTSDTTILVEKLNSVNRKLIDSESNRFMFIENPISLKVENAVKIKVQIAVHPDFPERGNRTFELSENNQDFFISKNDIKNLKVGDIFRLRYAYNIQITKVSESEIKAKYVSADIQKPRILFWLTIDSKEIEILMDDATKKVGLISKSALGSKVGNSLQIEKLGYCRVDSVEPFLLWFTHD